ncbi:hypothetical protein FXB40_10240 [Bradyrhizobium rifense]|uniref:Uncharacterized protein n=1 Tax=Bradyrhizobium rifense TaxID=515499 RepID=A0A5D3KIY4_9BRAD|nr:hypothetical protein FXB40_10240 [Bradyrhizobium rifense]
MPDDGIVLLFCPTGQRLHRAFARPLPLAGEVAPKARVRVLSSWGSRLRRHPHPSPPPQAGEGVHLLLGNQASLISSR